METTKANAQYNDYEGTVAADIRDEYGNNLGQWAKSHGVDTDRYFILGIRCYVGEAHAGQSERPVLVSVLGIDHNIAGSHYQAICDYIKSVDYRPKLTKFILNVSIEDYLNAFKRFDVSLLKRGLESMTEYEEEESIEVGN